VKIRASGVLVCALFLLSGCGTGLPSVASSPERIIEDADSYFERGKYFQSTFLYRAFLQRHPGHDRSDYAQFRLAESLYGDEDWALAAVEYRILVTNYGYSDLVDDGYFKEAMCFARQAPGPSHDQTKRLEALDKFERFVKVFTSSPLVADAQEQIASNQAVLAEKNLNTALFYIRYKLPDSGEIYLDKIRANYKDNDFWARATYHKSKLLLARGEEERALALLSEFIAYPKDLPEKEDALIIVTQLRNKQIHTNN
jgi:outer membrane assembly lipoprotein YfiO